MVLNRGWWHINPYEEVDPVTLQLMPGESTEIGVEALLCLVLPSLILREWRCNVPNRSSKRMSFIPFLAYIC